MLSPFVIQYCILVCNSKVDGVMFVAVGGDGDSVDGSTFLFGGITGGFRESFNTDIRSECWRIIDGWTPSGEECY